MVLSFKKTSTDINNLRVKTFKLPKMLGFISISLFFLLIVLPIVSSMTNNLWLRMFDSFIDLVL